MITVELNATNEELTLNSQGFSRGEDEQEKMGREVSKQVRSHNICSNLTTKRSTLQTLDFRTTQQIHPAIHSKLMYTQIKDYDLPRIRIVLLLE